MSDALRICGLWKHTAKDGSTYLRRLARWGEGDLFTNVDKSDRQGPGCESLRGAEAGGTDHAGTGWAMSSSADIAGGQCATRRLPDDDRVRARVAGSWMRPGGGDAARWRPDWIGSCGLANP